MTQSAGTTRIAVAVMGAILLIRLSAAISVLASHPDNVLSNDSRAYFGAAKSLVLLGTYSISPESPEVPMTDRTPGYPVFLSVFYRVFGFTQAPVVIAQVVISVLTIWMVWALARIVFNPAAALAAALLFSLDVPSFHSSLMVLTETLYTFLVTGAMLLAVLAMQGGSSARRTWLLCLGAASVLLLATFVRPIGYYLIAPLAFFMAASQWRTRRAVWIGTVAMAMVLLFGAGVGLWQYRNYRLTGSRDFATIQGRQIAAYKAAGVLSVKYGISLDSAQILLSSMTGDLRLQSQSAADSIRFAVARQVATRNPIPLVRMMLHGATNLLLSPGGEHLAALWKARAVAAKSRGLVGDLRVLPIGHVVKTTLAHRLPDLSLLAFSVVFLSVMYAFSLWGLYQTRGRLWPEWWLFGLLVLLPGIQAFLSIGPEAYFRFRVPLMPVVAVFAGYGATIALQRFCRAHADGRMRRASISVVEHRQG